MLFNSVFLQWCDKNAGINFTFTQFGNYNFRRYFSYQ